MELTKNERKTLKLLIDNSRITDSEIASKLNISSQAVGKIRRKLENSIIDSYSLNLNYYKLGINTFAMAVAKLTKEGSDKKESAVEQELLNNPHIINAFRIPKGSSTHILLYGFKNMNELDEFFHSNKLKEELHKFMETQDLFIFSHHSLLKNTPNQLFHKIIDDLGKKNPSMLFDEDLKKEILGKLQ